MKSIFKSLWIIAISIALNPAAASEDELRIISTDAGVTHVLLALGMGDELVGVDVTSEIPETLEAVNLGYHRTLSAEGLLSLNPNIIIGSEHMGPPEAINAVKKAGLQLLQLPIARTHHTLKDNITAISQLANKTTEAKRLLDQVDQAMIQVQTQQLATDTKVAFLLQMNGRGLRLAGLGTTGNDIIAMLGGENLVKHQGYQSVSSEALLSLEPDVIIVAGQKTNSSPIALLLKHHPMMQYTPAAKNQKIIEVDARLLVAGISLSAISAVADITEQLN